MPYLYQDEDQKGKPGAVWRYQIRDWRGKRIKGTGSSSKRETDALARRLEAEQRKIRKEVHRGLRLPPDQDVGQRSFPEIAEEYLAWGNAQGGHHGLPWGVSHAVNRKAHLKWWQKELNLDKISDLQGSLPKVEQSLRKLKAAGLAPKTIANMAEALAALCDWAVDRDYLPHDPLRKLAKLDTTPQVQRRAMTLGEIQTLLSVIPPDKKLAFEVALCSGLRVGELNCLTNAHLDTKRGGLQLKLRETKSRRADFLPLPEDLMKRLHLQACKVGPGVPLLHVSRHAARELDGYMKRAGIDKVKPGEGKLDYHATRTTFATLAIESGANVKEAQTLMRHSTPALTMNVYVRARSDRLQELAEKIGEKVRHEKTETPEGQQRKAEDCA